MIFVRITIEPDEMAGQPGIRALRIPVATVVAMVADGMSTADILAELPELEAAPVRERSCRCVIPREVGNSDSPDTGGHFVRPASTSTRISHQPYLVPVRAGGGCRSDNAADDAAGDAGGGALLCRHPRVRGVARGDAGGLRVPGDLALAGFDGLEEAGFSVPTLTTIAPDLTAMASIAVNALIERINATTVLPHRQMSCPYDLVIGQSSQRTPVKRNPRTKTVAALAR